MQVNFGFRFLLLLLSCSLILSCKGQKNAAAKVSSIDALIPRPLSVTKTGKVFEIKKKTKIYVADASKESGRVAEYLADKLKHSTGFDLPVSTTSGELSNGNILLSISTAENQLGEEGYELTVTENGVKLTA